MVDGARLSNGKFFPIKQTNADKIRQMSDDELARFLNSVETDGRLYGPRGYLLYWLDWLKQEVSDEPIHP